MAGIYSLIALARRARVERAQRRRAPEPQAVLETRLAESQILRVHQLQMHTAEPSIGCWELLVEGTEYIPSVHPPPAYASPRCGEEYPIAENYAFRTEQRSVTSLNTVAMYASASQHTTCAFANPMHVGD